MAETETLTYTKAVARNIVAARARCKGLTQNGLASRMQALGFDWRQQTVARVELGKRAVEAGELLGLALATETTIQQLISPSESDWESPLTLPSGETVSADYVTSLVYGMDRSAVTWADEKPQFGPDTKRAPDYSQRFVEMMRRASSTLPVEVKFTDAAGSAVTFTMPGLPRPGI
jgi:hypothetical protein